MAHPDNPPNSGGFFIGTWSHVREQRPARPTSGASAPKQVQSRLGERRGIALSSVVVFWVSTSWCPADTMALSNHAPMSRRRRMCAQPMLWSPTGSLMSMASNKTSPGTLKAERRASGPGTTARPGAGAQKRPRPATVNASICGDENHGAFKRRTKAQSVLWTAPDRIRNSSMLS